MSWLVCGPPVPTFRESIKKWKREISRSVRELQRLTVSLEAEEKTIVSNLKKMALKNKPAARELCRSMIKIRHQVTRVYRAINSMGDLGRELSSVEIIHRTQTTVFKSAQIFTSINQAMGVVATRNAMMAVGREMEKVGLIDQLIETGLNVNEDEQMKLESDEVYDKMIDDIMLGISATEVANSRLPPTAVTLAPAVEEPVPAGISMKTSSLSFPETPDPQHVVADDLNQDEEAMWKRWQNLKPPK